MKVLLTAVNAKYIHSNLAVYSLKAYAGKYQENIEIAEYTINHQEEAIIREIYKKKPDILAFSCYIWNISVVYRTARELKKVLPDTVIWLGGPEVSYDISSGILNESFVDGIIIGEGEASFLQLMEYYIDGQGELGSIMGIAYKDRENGGRIAVTMNRPLLSLDDIPFPYGDLKKFENKIIYYESSRGCPYSCSYCLSSIDKSVRFRSLALVERELDAFLKAGTAQVKFVDRTFNCNREHAMSVWKYISLHDNGITNFHFEISADLLNEEELLLLNSLRPGLVQLEIGVQSTNPRTIEAIHRRMDLGKLAHAVDRIREGHNIHQHLDLIAGLPYEDYASFRNSFRDVYRLKPDQLQLGFLKVLKGSAMYKEALEGRVVYQSAQPYEVLYTRWLPYEDVLRLKQVEDMVEVYYNSGQFNWSVRYLEHFWENPFDLYQELGDYYERQGYWGLSHQRAARYEILLDFCRECKEPAAAALEDIMVYDMYLRENLKSRPAFARDQASYKELAGSFYYEDEDRLRELLPGYEDYNCKQIRRMTHIEHFLIDIQETAAGGAAVYRENDILFDYRNRNPLNYEARTVIVKG